MLRYVLAFMLLSALACAADPNYKRPTEYPTFINTDTDKYGWVEKLPPPNMDKSWSCWLWRDAYRSMFNTIVCGPTDTKPE